MFIRNNAGTTRRLVTGFMVGSVASWSACTAAQETRNPTVLEEIIVTAQKRVQSLQDVPSTVNAVSEDLMRKTVTNTFEDLDELVSGMQFGGGGRDGFRSQIKIRGIGTSKNNPGIDPSVGIFINDIPYAKREQAFNNLTDIAQIEVLKGPQSTLFGKSVSSGAITITTKRPSTEAIEGFANVNLGSNELAEVSAGGNIPLGEQFAVRTSVYRDQDDGFVTNVRSDRQDPEFEGWGTRTRFLFEPNADFSAILGVEYNKTETTGSKSFKSEGGDLHFRLEDVSGTPFPLFEVGDRKNSSVSDTHTTVGELVSLHLDWRFAENWELTSISSYQNWDLDLDETEATEVPTQSQLAQKLAARMGTSAGLPLVPGGFSDTARQAELLSPFFTEQGALSRTQEFRVTYQQGRWSSIYGLFYADTVNTDKTSLLQTVGFLPDSFGGTQIGQALLVDNRDEVTDRGIFTHHTFAYTSDLDLIFGLRYSDVEKDSTKGFLLGQGPFAPLQNTGVSSTATEPPEQNNSWDALSGTLKANYRWRDGLSTYIGFSRAFKPGGVNTASPDPNTNNPTVTQPPFDEEIVQALEAGVKGEYFGNRLRWNAAAFYQLYDDYQVETTTPNGFALLIQNAAEVEIEGFETDVEWQATRQLNVTANLSYINARYEKFENATCTRPQYGRAVCEPGPPATMGGPPANFTRDLSGKRLDGVSPWSSNLFVTWTNRLGNTGWEYYLRAEHNFRDDIFYQADLDPDLAQGAYSVYNASVGFVSSDERYQVIIWGKNLADEEYLVDATRSRDFTQASFPFQPAERIEGYRGSEGEERTFGVDFRYNFMY